MSTEYGYSTTAAERQKKASEPRIDSELRSGKVDLPEEVKTVLEVLQQARRIRDTAPPRRPPEHEYFIIT